MKHSVKEMVGQTFNNLKVLDFKRENKRSYLQVECLLCGSTKWMRAESVKSSKSCGCLAKSTQFKMLDLKGSKFGRLTILEATDKRTTDNGSVIWQCRCDCGKIIEVPECLLTNGGVKSCGCLSKEIHAVAAKKTMSTRIKEECVDDTRLSNLVAKKSKRNTSGVKGVSWDSSRKKWTAQIVFKGKNHFLGRYETVEEAKKARAEAEELLFKPVLEKYNYKKKGFKL